MFLLSSWNHPAPSSCSFELNIYLITLLLSIFLSVSHQCKSLVDFFLLLKLVKTDSCLVVVMSLINRRLFCLKVFVMSSFEVKINFLHFWSGRITGLNLSRFATWFWLILLLVFLEVGSQRNIHFTSLKCIHHSITNNNIKYKIDSEHTDMQQNDKTSTFEYSKAL